MTANLDDVCIRYAVSPTLLFPPAVSISPFSHPKYGIMAQFSWALGASELRKR